MLPASTGAAVEQVIERLFDNPRAACLHLHKAKGDCYAARAERVWGMP
jgi:hypothetical protein